MIVIHFLDLLQQLLMFYNLLFLFQVTIDTNHVICYGQSNGSTAFPSGGVGPYTYLWSTSETTQTINNLSAGSYSVVVQDANFCQHTVYFDIVEPDDLILSTTLVNPTCHGYTNGTALVTPTGGNGIYSYLWTNGHTGQSITGLGAGTIGVTVTDGTNFVQLQQRYKLVNQIQLLFL